MLQRIRPRKIYQARIKLEIYKMSHFNTQFKGQWEKYQKGQNKVTCKLPVECEAVGRVGAGGGKGEARPVATFS